MAVYIKGMDMPAVDQGAITINIYADGVVTNYAGETIGEAVPIPPHGRLIDADVLTWKFTPDEQFYPAETDRFDYDSGRLMVRDIRRFIQDQPTIIPAESEGE